MGFNLLVWNRSYDLIYEKVRDVKRCPDFGCIINFDFNVQSILFDVF